MSNKVNIPADNKKRIEWFFKTYNKRLCAYAIKIYRVNPDAAQDVLYKSIYKLSETINDYQFESIQKLDSFVFRVFINFLKNHLRDNKSETETIYLEDLKNDLRTSTSVSGISDKVNLLNKELDKLEDWERILLLLRAQEMSYSEISKLIHKPEKQLKVYYGRLKQKLASSLKQAYLNIVQDEK
jgi:RNA polymerase sigma factor (sigma-70 family)